MVSVEVPPNFPIQPCVIEAVVQQQLPLGVFLSIAKQEGGRVGQSVPNRSARDGRVWSFDHGPMQINDYSWSTRVQKTFGVSMQQVRDDLCLNARVGAWIFRQAINDAKGNVWHGVAYYHSRNPQFANSYMWKVWGHYQRIEPEIRRLGWVGQ